jgi:hypothetical protein
MGGVVDPCRYSADLGIDTSKKVLQQGLVRVIAHEWLNASTSYAMAAARVARSRRRPAVRFYDPSGDWSNDFDKVSVATQHVIVR